MLRLRPFRAPDAKEIITWTNEPNEFYKWSAGILGDFPVSEERLLEAVSGSLDVVVKADVIQAGGMTKAGDTYTAEELGSIYDKFVAQNASN